MEGVSPFEPTVVGAVRRGWRLVVAVILALVIPVALFALARPKTYTATASLTVSDPTGVATLGTQQAEAPDRYVSDQLAVVDSADFGTAAAKRGLEQKPPLRKSPNWFISHTTDSANAQNSNLLTLSFKAPSARLAMSGVQAAVAAYSDVVKAATAARSKAVGAQLDALIASLDTRLRQLGTSADPAAATRVQQLNAVRGPLQARRDQVAAEAALPGDGIGQTLLPTAATTTGKSAALRLVVLAFAVGLLLGVALAYARSYRRRVFTDARDPELVLAAPLLSDVSSLSPRDLSIRSKDDWSNADEKAEQMFAIAASLAYDQLPENDEFGASLAVVGAQNDATCNAVAWRAALAFAARDLRVLLIDADGSWSPPLDWIDRTVDRHNWVERADGTVGLGEPRSIASGRPFPTRGRSSPPPRPQWAVSFCAKPPPVRSQRALDTLFRTLEQDYDLVLVNAPPILLSADAANLVAAAKRVLVVVCDGESVTDHEEFVRRLRLAGALPIGYIYSHRPGRLKRSRWSPSFEVDDREWPPPPKQVEIGRPTIYGGASTAEPR